jgi:hypothetical protein
VVAHICNIRYSEGRDQEDGGDWEDWGLKQAQAKS